jgi:hypothetical protein
MRFANATNINRKSGEAERRDPRFALPSNNCPDAPFPVYQGAVENPKVVTLW